MDPEDPQFTRTLPSQSRAAARAPEPGPPATVPAKGEFIDRYRIRGRIGEGGMGVVFAAEDPELGRVVAIKLLRSVEGSDAEVHQRRMLREAQALARVSHRNLVTVFDVGTRDGRVWIAMEYVVGDTLEAWLQRDRRTWREIVDVFIQAGRGLAAVHGAGLVHRDFKPGNVIVRGDGTAQVLDFGLVAQAGERIVSEMPAEGDARPELDALAATLTETGGIMGTPAYMAPEQFLQLGADAHADQFSFSVALFEALYGHRPFKGKDLPDLMRAAIDGLRGLPPELPGLPEVVRKVIARGLSSDPSKRFPDMDVLLAELESTRAPREVVRSGGWSRFALGMLVGGGALAGGLYVWISRIAEDSPAPAPAAAPLEAQADEPAAEVEEEPAALPLPPEPDEEVPVVLPADLPAEAPVPAVGESPSRGGTMPPPIETPLGNIQLPGLQDLDEPPPEPAKPEPAEPAEPDKPAESAGGADDKPPSDPSPAEGGDSPPT